MGEAGAAADALDRERLLRSLAARRRVARHIEIVAECASTSDLLKERLAAAQCDGLLIATEHQTGGRGRRVRDWWSGPPGTNLAVSVALCPAPQPAEVGGVLAACALAAALRPWNRELAALQWPNDLLLGGAKVAGVLAELPALGGEAHPPLVLGVGINVLAAPPPDAAPYATCSLAERSARRPDRTAVLAGWLWALEKRVQRFVRTGPASLEAEFLELLRRWAPHGVRAGRDKRGEAAAPAGGSPRAGRELPAGALRGFSFAQGLSWGPEAAPTRVPLGWLPSLEALPEGGD